MGKKLRFALFEPQSPPGCSGDLLRKTNIFCGRKGFVAKSRIFFRKNRKGQFFFCGPFPQKKTNATHFSPGQLCVQTVVCMFDGGKHTNKEVPANAHGI